MKKTYLLTIIIFISLTLSGCLNTKDNQEISIIKIDENTVLINPENIKIYFPDGFQITDLTDKKSIYFGPAKEKEKTGDYILELIPHQDQQRILKRYREISDILIYNPSTEPINGYQVVKVIEAGYCEKRISQLVGQSINLKFYSQNCSQDRDADFNYFDRIILNIKKNNEK